MRTIRPLDTATVLESVARTNRLMVVKEGPTTAAGRVVAVAAPVAAPARKT